MQRNEQLTIHCANGVSAELETLHQDRTYDGLLDGAPTHRLNQDLLDRIERTAAGRPPVHLVRSPEVPFQAAYRFREDDPPMQLPATRCRGLFRADLHELWIVWFQHTWAPPIEPAVLAELFSLDFMVAAQEINW